MDGASGHASPASGARTQWWVSLVGAAGLCEGGLGLASALLIAFGMALAAARLDNNLHVLVPGEAHRSSQPNGAEITRYRAASGIPSIINLWGAQKGVVHYDFGMIRAWFSKLKPIATKSGNTSSPSWIANL